MDDGLEAIAAKEAQKLPAKRRQALSSVTWNGREYRLSKDEIRLEQIAAFFQNLPSNMYAFYSSQDNEGMAVIYAIPFLYANQHLEILRHFTIALGIFARSHQIATGPHYIDSQVRGVAGGLYTKDAGELMAFLKSLNIRASFHQILDGALDERAEIINKVKSCIKSKLKSGTLNPTEYVPAFRDFLRYEMGRNPAAKDKPWIYELGLPNPTPALKRYFKMILNQK